jgi:hypothetical protein
MESYRICSEKLAHETLEGETVIVDKLKGLYYSLTGAAADVWTLLDAGVPLPGIVAALSGRGAAAELVEAGVRTLIDELLGEELIAPGAAPAATQVPVITGAWVAPRLEKFTDLQTLLLLDPIHDVDEQGWPRVAPSRAGTE